MLTYAQFCALARAAEVVGERWTLLVVRELLLGPRRFTDLRDSLSPIAPSVLTERLGALEARGVIEHVAWPGPVPGKVYRLTADGEALRPAIHELTRWGSRYLFPARPSERFDPAWLRIVFEAYAAKRPTPLLSIAIYVDDGETPAAVVTGGPGGTQVLAVPIGPVSAALRGDPATILGIMSGKVGVAAAAAEGRLRMEGDTGAAGQIAALFATDDRT